MIGKGFIWSPYYYTAIFFKAYNVTCIKKNQPLVALSELKCFVNGWTIKTFSLLYTHVLQLFPAHQ